MIARVGMVKEIFMIFIHVHIFLQYIIFIQNKKLHTHTSKKHSQASTHEKKQNYLKLCYMVKSL